MNSPLLSSSQPVQGPIPPTTANIPQGRTAPPAAYRLVRTAADAAGLDVPAVLLARECFWSLLEAEVMAEWPFDYLVHAPTATPGQGAEDF